MKAKASGRVAARLGDKVLKNVDKYFSGKPYAIAVEMLQNARRAGATKIEVTTLESGSVTISDNGAGLAREDAPVLLTFGGSANRAEVEFRENPAGMGFFSLAGRRVQVASRDWEMTISPDTFTGGQDALLSASGNMVARLRVEIDSFAPTRAEAIDALKRAAAPMPMETVIDGSAVSPQPFSSFLEGRGTTTVSRSVHGCEISVCRWDDISAAKHVTKTYYSPNYDIDMAVDMFGQTFLVTGASPSALREYIPSIGASTVEGALVDLPTDAHSLTYERSSKPFWRIAIKIGEASVLAPRLPERDGIVINDGWRTIVAEIESMIVELASGLKANAIHEKSPIRAIASRLGRSVPAERTVIRSASYQSRHGSGGEESTMRQVIVEIRDGQTVAWRNPDAPPASECLVKPVDLEVAAEAAIAFALVGKADDQLRIIEPFGTPEEQAAYGYRQADKISAKVSTKDGRTFNLDMSKDLTGTMMGGTGKATSIIAETTEDAGILASSISIRISGGGVKIAIAADVIAWNDDESIDEDTRFIALEGVAEYQIVTQMMHVYGWYSDDPSADSYDSQKEAIESTFMDMVSPVTEGEVGAIVSKAQELMANALRDLRYASKIEIAQISIKPNRRKAGDGNGRATHRLTITLGDGSRHSREI